MQNEYLNSVQSVDCQFPCIEIWQGITKEDMKMLERMLGIRLINKQPSDGR